MAARAWPARRVQTRAGLTSWSCPPGLFRALFRRGIQAGGAAQHCGRRGLDQDVAATLSPGAETELRLSGQHDVLRHTPQVPFSNDQVEIASIVPQVNVLDSIEIAGMFVLGGGNIWDANSVNQYQLADQIPWIHGRHSIRLGFEIDRRQWNVSSPAYARGSLSIGSFADFLLGLPGCPPGNSTCSADNPKVNGVDTNGTPFSSVYGSVGAGGGVANVTAPAGIQHGFRYGDGSAYLQDEFRILPRLTLTAGVRWDYLGFPGDSTGNNTNFWLSLANAWSLPPAGGTYAGFVVPSNLSGSLPAGVVRNNGRTPMAGDGTGFGNSGVGFILGPGHANTDVAVSKAVEIKDSKIEFRAEFFNALNHPQFSNPNQNVSDGPFGKITSTSVNPRLIQFALKYLF